MGNNEEKKNNKIRADRETLFFKDNLEATEKQSEYRNKNA